MSECLVSVIIPTFNRGQFLIKAIESVYHQAFKDYELIIVDDCSDDETWSICISNQKRFEQIGVSFTYLKNEKNYGVSYSRNQGALKAKGEWIAFLDSDDQWHKNKLLKQVAQLTKDSVLIHTNETWIKDGAFFNQHKKHQKAAGDQFLRSIELCCISPSSAMIKKDIYFDLGMMDENLVVCEDYDFWLKVTARYNVDYIDEKLITKFGGHNDQLSTRYHSMDYYRLIGLINILEQKDEINKASFPLYIDEYKEMALNKNILKKLKILKKGAIKHRNNQLISNLDELESKTIIKKIRAENDFS